MPHPPSRSRPILLTWVLLVFAVLASTSIARSGRAEDPIGRDLERRRSQVKEAVRILEQPLRWSEKNRLFRFVGRVVSSDSQPHFSAIRMLSNSGLPEAVAPLLAAIEDRESPYRMDAAIALNMLTPEKDVLPPLIALFDDPDLKLRGALMRIVGIIGGSEGPAADGTIEPAVRQLRKTLADDPGPEIRVSALLGLVNLEREEALFAAFSLGVRDSHPLVRCALIKSAAEFVAQRDGRRIGPRRFRKMLHANLDPSWVESPLGIYRRAYHHGKYFSDVMLESDCIDVNEVAMAQLALLGDRSVLPNLIRASRARDPGLRASTLRSLAEFEQDEAFAVLVDALDDPLFGVRRSAIVGLGESLHPKADGVLSEVLRDAEPNDRRAAAAALGGSFGASAHLIRSFGDRAVQVRDQAEESLLRSDEVVVKFEQALARADQIPDLSEEQRVKRRARIEDEMRRWQAERLAAERSLADGLGSEDIFVRIRSARVLAKFESPESLSLLLTVLRANTSPQSETAALGLGLRGDPSAREALEEAARSQDEEISVAAIRALMDIAEPDSLPTLRALERDASLPRIGRTAGFAIAMLEMKEARQE